MTSVIDQLNVTKIFIDSLSLTFYRYLSLIFYTDYDRVKSNSKTLNKYILEEYTIRYEKTFKRFKFKILLIGHEYLGFKNTNWVILSQENS